MAASSRQTLGRSGIRELVVASGTRSRTGVRTPLSNADAGLEGVTKAEVDDLVSE